MNLQPKGVVALKEALCETVAFIRSAIAIGGHSSIGGTRCARLGTAAHCHNLMTHLGCSHHKLQAVTIATALAYIEQLITAGRHQYDCRENNAQPLYYSNHCVISLFYCS